MGLWGGRRSGGGDSPVGAPGTQLLPALGIPTGGGSAPCGCHLSLVQSPVGYPDRYPRDGHPRMGGIPGTPTADVGEHCPDQRLTLHPSGAGSDPRLQSRASYPHPDLLSRSPPGQSPSRRPKGMGAGGAQRAPTSSRAQGRLRATLAPPLFALLLPAGLLALARRWPGPCPARPGPALPCLPNPVRPGPAPRGRAPGVEAARGAGQLLGARGGAGHGAEWPDPEPPGPALLETPGSDVRGRRPPAR